MQCKSGKSYNLLLLFVAFVVAFRCIALDGRSVNFAIADDLMGVE